MKTTLILMLTAVNLVAQEYVPRVMPLKGYTLYRRNDSVNWTVQTTKWTATPDYCIERITWMKTWNKPTNSLVIPVSGSVNVTERWYYKDPTTRLFCSFTNIAITYVSGVWVTNTTPTWPVKIAEAPISFHGSVFYAGTNGISESREGDVVYKIDATKCTRPYYVIFNFRLAPVSSNGDEDYLEYCTALLGFGEVHTWYPNMASINAKLGRKPRYMWKKGYAPTHVRPIREAQSNFVMDANKNMVFTNTEN